MARPKASAAARFADFVHEVGMTKVEEMLEFLKHFVEEKPLRRKKSPKTDPDPGALGEDVQLGGDSKPTPTQ